MNELPLNGGGTAAVVSALDPSFRAQELAFAVTQIAESAELAAAADRRTWFVRMLGRSPSGLPGAVSAAKERAVAHFEPHSVWLHNSLRGAAGLSLAVLVASMTGVQHSFWVVLGTLSVLRSNALSTGQSVVRGLAGTAAGVLVGGALVALIGSNTTLLWLLLPIAVLVAGFAPAAVSFEAGQAAFTVTIVILFNIIAPAGWRVGLVRIEDVAIGFAVSLVVGLLFWPRGAARALGQELAEAYVDSARYLAAAVDFGAACCDRQVPPPPEAEALRAAADRPAARRRVPHIPRRARGEEGSARRCHRARERRRRRQARRRRGARPLGAGRRSRRRRRSRSGACRAHEDRRLGGRVVRRARGCPGGPWRLSPIRSSEVSWPSRAWSTPSRHAIFVTAPGTRRTPVSGSSGRAIISTRRPTAPERSWSGRPAR